MSVSRFIWGVVVFGLGLALLGANLGWWPGNIWQNLLVYWPVILILIGLRIIIKNDNVFIVIFLFTLVGVLMLAIQNPYNIREKLQGVDDNERVSETVTEEKLDDTTSLSMEVNIGAAEMRIDGGNDLYNLTTENMGNIEAKTNNQNGKSTVTISEDSGNFLTGGFSNRKFNLEIAKNVPLELSVSNGASEMDFDFTETALTKLNLSTGASSGTITFGTLATRIESSIKAGASKLTLRIPEGFAVKIINSSALTTFDYGELGLTKEGNTYTSQDYETNQKKIDINISSGASSINIDRY